MTWQSTRLKFLASQPIRNGLGEAGSNANPDWPRYVRTTDIAGPRELREDVFASLPPEVAQKAALRSGDILMTAAGATIGKSLLYLGDAPACYAGYLVRFRPKDTVDPRFIAYWTESAPYWDQIKAGRVMSTIENFSASKYRNLRLSVPPLSDQQAIADHLDRQTSQLDALIDAKRRMVALVDERWQSVMHNAVSGRLGDLGKDRRATRIPWLDSIPAHWREGQLKLVARLGSGHTPSRSRPEWWVNPTIPWITTGEVAQMRTDRIEYIDETREHISELGLENSSAEIHPAGTVVLCRTASAGYSAIMGRDMATSQDFATWTCGPLLQPEFLLLCLRAMRQDLLGRLAMGSTHKTIYMPDIESISVPIPPIGEQKEMVEIAHGEQAVLDACAEQIRIQAGLLRERRQALVTAAVTGRLDVPEVA